MAIPLADDSEELNSTRADVRAAESGVAELSTALADEQAHGDQAERDLTQARASGSRAVQEAQASAAAQAAANDSRGANLDEREQAVAARESAVSTVEREAARNTFGEGLFLVGQEIQPGRYRSDGGDGCYWERLSGLSGELGDIITNDISDGPTVVEISPSDIAFSSSRCGNWTKTS